jgi:hypothetical protein
MWHPDLRIYVLGLFDMVSDSVGRARYVAWLQAAARESTKKPPHS